MSSGEKIKSGPEVVSDFLDALKTNKEIDGKVVEALTTLASDGKLSKTRLLNSLQILREDQSKATSGSSKEGA